MAKFKEAVWQHKEGGELDRLRADNDRLREVLTTIQKFSRDPVAARQARAALAKEQS